MDNYNKAKPLPTDPAILPETPSMPRGIVMERQLLIDIQRAIQEGTKASLEWAVTQIALRLP